MKISNNRFEESDTKTRKRHEVVLTTDSPDSISSEMELSAGDIIHTVPSEKALADKAERQAQGAKAEASYIVEETEGAENTVEQAISEENSVEE